MALNPPLCVEPDALRELGRDEEGTLGLLRDFFLVSPQDPQFPAVVELFTSFTEFCGANLRRPDSAAALFTVLTELHAWNVGRAEAGYEGLRAFARERLVAYSLECPPFHSAFFGAEDLPAVARFLDAFYLRDYKLWRYLFCPTPLLRVRARPGLRVRAVQAPEQLGRAAAGEAGAEGSRPPSGGRKPAKGGKRPAEEPAPAPEPAPRRALPYTRAPLPLARAELYVPPEPRPPEELAAEAVREAVREALGPEGPGGPGEGGEPAPALDVERLGGAIEAATRAELERVRAELLAEIEAARAPEPGRRR